MFIITFRPQHSNAHKPQKLHKGAFRYHPTWQVSELWKVINNIIWIHPETPIQRRTWSHNSPKMGQETNKCWALSTPPHPETHNCASWARMECPCHVHISSDLHEFSFVVSNMRPLTYIGVYDTSLLDYCHHIFLPS